MWIILCENHIKAREKMIKTIVFADEITLWWTKGEFAKNTDQYKVYLNGKYHGKTDKTHYSFLGLKPEQVYCVSVEAYASGKLAVVKEYEIQTSKEKKRLDVTKEPYFVIGDGKTVNTATLQKILDDSTENDYIYFPAGTYLTGALNVHSNTEIYLEKDAVLQGTVNETDYLPKIKSRFEGTEMMCYRSLINMGELDYTNYDYACKNVILRGKGAIYGGGKPLAVAMQDKERERLKGNLAQNAEYVKTCETVDTIPGRVRGRLINMSNCEHIVMSGLTMGYGPSWNIHFVYSKDIVTYGCKICSNKIYRQDGTIEREAVWNGDGWDPDSSEDCAVFDTVFQTGDDCVAIKSGKNPEGNIVNRPTKNVYIFNCRVENGHSISIGSEMSGGVENVYVWDCDLRNAYFGMQVKSTKKRGGYVKKLFVQDCVLQVIYVRCANYNDDGESAGNPPVLSDYYYENVTVLGKMDSSREKIFIDIGGYEEKDYYLRNVNFHRMTFLAEEDEKVIRKEYTDEIGWTDIRYIKDKKC